MFVGLNNTGQYKLNIIPVKYDTTVSDLKILRCIDSLPGGAFHSKMYNLLYADDSGKLAVQVNEGTYLFKTRYEVVVYYKNGNIKRRTYYTKHLKRYWEFDYYEDASPKATGHYRLHDADWSRKNTKTGKWTYYDTDGNLVRKEIYSKYSDLKSSSDYNPPKHTTTTTMNPKHPKGLPYVIQ